MDLRASTPYADTALPAPRRMRHRIFRFGAVAIVVAFTAVLLALLRPVSLGGSTGYTIVAGQSMTPTLRSGDLVVTQRQDSYAVGDIVVYTIPADEPGAGVQIVHRVVGGTAGGYAVRGDNKDGVDPWRPRADDVVGKVRVTVPHAGSGLLLLRTPLGLAAMAAMATLLMILVVIRSPVEDGG